MKLKFALLFTVLLSIPLTAMSGQTPIFQKRPARECEDLNPEMTDWFKESYSLPAKERSPAPIERIIGPVKKQQVGWCFAFSAADMLSHEAGFSVSGAYVAKTYYEHSWLASIRGVKESGVLEDALEISLDRPLCDEHGFSSKTIANYSMAKKQNCTTPTTKLKDYEVKYYEAEGYFDGFRLFNKLDTILSDGRIAGIQYDVDYLTQNKLSNSGKTLDNHASTIVGRYYDHSDATCRYVIRNTFGNGCIANINTKTQCVNGYYSVTEAQLNTMLVKVVSLKKKR